MEPVIFTDAAAAHIKQMLVKNPNAKGFRLSVKKTGCSGFSYVPELVENIHADDLHYEVQQNLAVYIDQGCLQFFETLTVDYVEDEAVGLKQKRLVFINPQEKGRCGCGESFTM